MTLRWLIWRSLVFHARAHAGTFLGSVVATVVLVGALVVGDSVRGSLRKLAEARLGRIEVVLSAGDRLFRSDLFGYGPGYLTYLAGMPGTPAQPALAITALELPAVAVAEGGAARANRVVIRGVDARFWQFAPEPAGRGEIPPDQVLVNEVLARQLRVGTGDEVVLRVQRPTAVSRDVPLAPEENSLVALRLRVGGVVPGPRLGDFSLEANSLPPFNAFVSLPFLQAQLGVVGRANLVLAGAVGAAAPGPFAGSGGPVSIPGLATNLIEVLERTLRQRWRLEDAGLELREIPGGDTVELRTARVFLDTALTEALPTLFAGTNAAVDSRYRAKGLLTYFVNELRVGDRSTPYSMVTAGEPPLIAEDLRDDEVMINQWLADDLGAAPGDTLDLKYYTVGMGRRLEERTAAFRIRGVYPVSASGVDSTLVPEFPGLTTARSCREWDTGLPIQPGRIRPQDEAYWAQYRGTPKALITLAAGQRLWGNRFGSLTAIRFSQPGWGPAGNATRLGIPAGPPMSNPSVPLPAARSLGGLRTLLVQRLDPAWFGLGFRPVRLAAVRASEEGQDFGQLFLGFSFFLMAAALVLVALLFRFALERRVAEVGVMRALGFTPGRLRRALLAEGTCVVLAGAVVGGWVGVGYAGRMLHGLNTTWNVAVGGTQLVLQAGIGTVVVGSLVAVVVVTGSMALALRQMSSLPPRVLLAGAAELESVLDPGSWDGGLGRRGRWRVVAALGTVCLAAICSVSGYVQDAETAANLFFASGGLMLVGGWLGLSIGLSWLAAGMAGRRLTANTLALRGAVRRRRRGGAVIGMLGCGSFLIAAIGVFRLDTPRDASVRGSGTGGFALFGQSSHPVVPDLDEEAGRLALGMDPAKLSGVAMVALRVRDGDDASCLNLNRAQRPRLLGLRPELLARRAAFQFAEVLPGHSRAEGWNLLNLRLDRDEVPGIADEATIRWALGQRIGGAVEFEDGRGGRFRVRLVGSLANSVLQGSVVVGESAFVERFPAVTGYRMFLVDAPVRTAMAVAGELTRALQDYGLELSSTLERLAAFNAVQNTYLTTFQALGGLGLLLGSAGLGVLVLRNVQERRGELAAMAVVGWQPRRLRRLVANEHGALLVAGLALGIGAAAAAVFPSVIRRGEVPIATLGLTMLAVGVNGCLWAWLAARSALRGSLVDALRND